MKIIRELNKNGNLLPSIINLVHSIPENYQFHDKYLYRNPVVIANRSLQRVFDSFNYVIEEHDRITLLYKKEKDKKGIQQEEVIKPLAMAITELFESIVSHIEDCLIILKCSTPPPAKKIKAKFVNHWLKEVNHPTSDDFIKGVSEYRNEVAAYVNKIKHEHGRIKIVFGLLSDNILIGYCIKNVAMVEDKFKKKKATEVLDLNLTRSIITDLKYHLYNIYNVSNLLVEHYQQAFSYYFTAEFTLNKQFSTMENALKILNRLANDTDLVFLNNELLTPKTHIKFDDKVLSITYPIGIVPLSKPFVDTKCTFNNNIATTELVVPKPEVSIRLKRNLEENDNKTFKVTLNRSEIFLLTITKQKVLIGNVETDHIIVNYDNLLKVFTYKNLGFHTTLVQFLDSNEINVKQVIIDYFPLNFSLDNIDLLQ